MQPDGPSQELRELRDRRDEIRSGPVERSPWDPFVESDAYESVLQARLRQVADVFDARIDGLDAALVNLAGQLSPVLDRQSDLDAPGINEQSAAVVQAPILATIDGLESRANRLSELQVLVVNISRALRV